MSLKFDNVTLSYDGHPAVHHLSADLPTGSLTAIVGPNGAGKSTLLKSVIGELRPVTGAIKCEVRREDIAYLPQLAQIDRTFPVSVLEMVAMGLWRHIGPFGGLTREGREKVSEAIATVGLEGFERRSIGALSGGQLQRVLFARLLLQDAALILLDEPFTAIDRRTVDDLIAVIKRWHGEGRTVAAVLHDHEEVRRHFPRCMLMARELIAVGPTDDVLTTPHLTRARTISEAVDEHAAPCQRAA